MKLNNLLVINSILLGISGLIAIVFPEIVLSFYGVMAEPAVKFMAQFAGLGSVTIALIAWHFRNIKDLKIQQAIIFPFIITYIIAIIISVEGTISGVIKISWPIIVLYSLFVLGYGYFLFIKVSDEKKK